MAAMKPMLLLVQMLLLSLDLVNMAYGEEYAFIYSGFTDQNITLDGAAMVTRSGLLDLTNGSVRLNGHAFYPSPLPFRKFSDGMVQSFSTSFVFGVQSSYPSQGFAFFIAPSKNFSSALAVQFLGLFNNQNNGDMKNQIFAVEFDSIKNIEFQDIDNNHVGIDINSLTSVDAFPAGFYDDKDGTFSNLTIASNEAMQVWVDYNGDTAQISVTTAPMGVVKPLKPLGSIIHNLSSVLSEMAYVGFSSAAGRDNTRHYILGWSFGLNRPAPSFDITNLPKMPRFGPKGRSKVLEIILPIASAVSVLSIGTVIFLLVRRHLRYLETREDWEVEFGPHRFSFRDLFHATEGFKNKNLLGIGGFGRVYKGMLPVSKLDIAVKRVSHDSKQGMKEFVAEVVSIGRLQHRNIVQLLGYCRRKGELFLVYDYMPNGSLDKYLYGQEDKQILTWAQRFRVIKGIASGLAYLHEEWEKVVVHRDIKASNVLLDTEMNGRLGDFGLARLYDHGADAQTTRVVGTIGYLAPELASSGKATPLTDVFSFGIFVLEVTCGQRPIKEDISGNTTMLVDWVLEHWQKGTLTDAVDVRLQDDYDLGEVSLALKLGLLCSHPFADARPKMQQVMQYLQGQVPIPEDMPPNLSFEMLTLMQNEGFDSYIMSYPSSITNHSDASHASCAAMSALSGGR
ncbi:L-type lectin-domain containing receptor kinase SIT2-like [Oryza brachyantha]|uniref:non-specific serine/threonine protein kinase n=1 Tax=Oryza brachyantha TaxID=4533 RepID=J3MW08_ORYBR|nr:L-type lectin-domain containing receptor kinase SIT2-like [Oryza brachyantha]